MGSGKAILVIDMQRDFVECGSPVCVAGAKVTLPSLSRFLDAGRRSGWSVVYICRRHHPSGVDAERFRRHLFECGRPVCADGTPGAEICGEIAPQEGDFVVVKQRFDGFFRTGLETLLRGLDVETVYITGTQYPNCVRATAVGALERDFTTVVVTDCCSAADEATAMANIADLRRMEIRCERSDIIIADEMQIDFAE